jgi:hypothetical protein
VERQRGFNAWGSTENYGKKERQENEKEKDVCGEFHFSWVEIKRLHLSLRLGVEY